MHPVYQTRNAHGLWSNSTIFVSHQIFKLYSVELQLPFPWTKTWTALKAFQFIFREWTFSQKNSLNSLVSISKSWTWLVMENGDLVFLLSFLSLPQFFPFSHSVMVEDEGEVRKVLQHIVSFELRIWLKVNLSKMLSYALQRFLPGSSILHPLCPGQMYLCYSRWTLLIPSLAPGYLVIYSSQFCSCNVEWPYWKGP